MNVAPPIFHITGLTSHFCLYYKSAYDKLIAEYRAENESTIVVIDLFNRKALRTFCTTPFLAIQTPGKSDLENEFVDYTVHFSNGEAKLNEFIGRQKTLEGFSISDSDQRLAVNFVIASVSLVILLICTNQRRRR